ncbi:MAG: cobalamin-binding protein [Anaerolineae bacterium]
MKSVVSLIPSATEIVAALGFADALVGRSHECDFPARVTHLPVCTEPKFNPHGTSAEIDGRVKQILRDALSVYRIHTDVLEHLAPDVIVTQAQCEVCAVSLRDVESAVCEVLSPQAQLVALEPNALADVFADIARVAAALEAPQRGEALIGQLKSRMAAIEDAASHIAAKPTVACIEWIEPLMAAGNWMPELVQMAGGTNLFGEAGKHSPWMDWEALRAADPEVIVVLPCGFDIPRTLQEMPLLEAHEGWQTLQAVRANRIYVTDGNQYFNRPGPRLAESLEILAEIFHPDRFHFGHQGIGWRRYQTHHD